MIEFANCKAQKDAANQQNPLADANGTNCGTKSENDCGENNDLGKYYFMIF